MINVVPQHLINCELYIDGEREPSGVASIDLPEINFLSTEVKGAGILGTYDSSVLGHVEALESTIHCRTLRKDSAALMQQKKAFMLSAYGATQVYDSATGELGVEPVRCDMRCLPKSFKPGKFEPGEQTETEVVVTVDYIKITVDGSVALELVVFNYIYNVNGVDMLSDVRAALGF